MSTKKLSSLICICVGIALSKQQTFAQLAALQTAIEKTTKNLAADIGISVIDLQTNDTLAVNGNKHFPMQSVFKFHIGLAALHLVDHGKLSLDGKYQVSKNHYFKSWSVLMRNHPEANVEVTLKELITWTVM